MILDMYSSDECKQQQGKNVDMEYIMDRKSTSLFSYFSIQLFCLLVAFQQHIDLNWSGTLK